MVLPPGSPIQLTVMDCHEMGGELASLKRKEATILKKPDLKVKSEAKWQSRLLSLFE